MSSVNSSSPLRGVLRPRKYEAKLQKQLTDLKEDWVQSKKSYKERVSLSKLEGRYKQEAALNKTQIEAKKRTLYVKNLCDTLCLDIAKKARESSTKESFWACLNKGLDEGLKSLNSQQKKDLATKSRTLLILLAIGYCIRARFKDETYLDTLKSSLTQENMQLLKELEKEEQGIQAYLELKEECFSEATKKMKEVQQKKEFIAFEIRNVLVQRSFLDEIGITEARSDLEKYLETYEKEKNSESRKQMREEIPGKVEEFFRRFENTVGDFGFRGDSDLKVKTYLEGIIKAKFLKSDQEKGTVDPKEASTAFDSVFEGAVKELEAALEELSSSFFKPEETGDCAFSSPSKRNDFIRQLRNLHNSSSPVKNFAKLKETFVTPGLSYIEEELSCKSFFPGNLYYIDQKEAVARQLAIIESLLSLEQTLGSKDKSAKELLTTQCDTLIENWVNALEFERIENMKSASICTHDETRSYGSYKAIKDGTEPLIPREFLPKEMRKLLKNEEGIFGFKTQRFFKKYLS